MKSFRLCLVIHALTPQLLWADSNFCAANNSPFHQYHYIPCTTTTPSSNFTEIQFTTERSNIFYYDEGGVLGDESVIVDGEVNRHVLRIENKVGRIVIGGEVSQVSFASGNWDSAIEDWHSSFNFVNWDRENHPKDQLNFKYQSEEGLLSISEAQNLERFSIHMGLTFHEDRDWINVIRIGRSISSESELVAPESTWVSVRSSEIEITGGHSVSAGAGVSHSAANGALSSIQEPWVFFGALEYQYRWHQKFKLLGSVSGNSAHYRSESVILGRPSSQISAALAWLISRESQWSLAILEDLSVGASPDVTLQLSYRYRSH